MSGRRVNLVLLCEDKQHEVFARRFLSSRKWSIRQMRVERGSGGSQEQYVREQFPKELKAYRGKRAKVESQALIVVTDGDEATRNGRMKMLDEECDKKGEERRRQDERVAVFIPTWNIETWLAYLDGETVDESRKDYPGFKGRERECQRHVSTLVDMCQRKQLREPAPDSLIAACEEFSNRLETARL